METPPTQFLIEGRPLTMTFVPKISTKTPAPFGTFLTSTLDNDVFERRADSEGKRGKCQRKTLGANAVTEGRDVERRSRTRIISPLGNSSKNKALRVLKPQPARLSRSSRKTIATNINPATTGPRFQQSNRNPVYYRSLISIPMFTIGFSASHLLQFLTV